MVSGGFKQELGDVLDHILVRSVIHQDIYTTKLRYIFIELSFVAIFPGLHVIWIEVKFPSDLFDLALPFLCVLLLG